MFKDIHNKYHFTKRFPGALGKQLKPIFLGRKERRNGQRRGNHPHTLGNALPAYGLLPSLPGSRPGVTRVAARGEGCTLAHCLPTASLWSMRSRWPRLPEHTSDTGPASSCQQGNLLFILWQGKATEEGGRPSFSRCQGS